MREDRIALSPDQYNQILKEIWDKHRFGGLSRKFDDYDIDRCKNIKYVRPNWDMRDGCCFSITFNGLFAGGVDGLNFNSGYGETIPMFNRIMKWLGTPNAEFRPQAIESTEQPSPAGAENKS